jgi:transposase
LRQSLEQYEFFLSQITNCDKQIQSKLLIFSTVNVVEKPKEMETTKVLKKKRSRKLKPFEFAFDLEAELIRITGVNLTRLAGIGPSTALTLIAETGLDMTRWKSVKHFSSWLKLAANNKISGGKILRSRTKPGKNRAALALRMAVSGLYNESNDTALGAFFRIKRAQIGAPKAITAAAHKLARMYYYTMLTKKEFVEPGAQAYLDMQKTKYLRRVRRTIGRWGLDIVEKTVTQKVA